MDPSEVDVPSHRVLSLSPLVAATVLVVLTLPILAGVAMTRSVHDLVETDALARLEVLAETTEKGLVLWSKARAQLALQLAADPTIRLHAAALIDTPDDALASSPHQLALRAHLADLIRESDFQGFFVIRPDGTSVGSTRDANLATANPLWQVDEAREQLEAGRAVVGRPQRSDVPLMRDGVLVPEAATMFAAAPLVGSDGKRLGYLTLRIDPSLEFMKIVGSANPGETGGTYAVGPDGRLLSPRRDMTTAAWRQAFEQSAPTTAATALDGGAPLTGTESTKAEPAVLHAQRWVRPLSLAVVTEWPTVEALAPAHRVRDVVWAGVALFELVLLIGLAAAVGRSRAQARERAEFQLVLDAAPVPISVRALDGTPVMVNRAHVESFGSAAPTPASLSEVSADCPDIQDIGGAGDRMFSAVRTRLPETVRGVPVVCTVALDITEQRKACDSLLAATEDARQANVAKDAFLARMSHELRTPLNGILGLVELSLDEANPRVVATYLEQARTTAALLKSQVSEVLDYSKIRSDEIDLVPAPFALDELLEPLAALVTGSVPSGAVEFLLHVRPSVPDRMFGDLTRLRQVLVNLVSNAAKFTRAGRIVVELDAHETQSGGLRLDGVVEDSGIGFDPALADEIFAPFQQATAHTTRDFGGTGLGLAICRRVVAAMGGDITAEGRPGMGSTFRFHVHVEATDDAAPVRPCRNQRVGVVAADPVRHAVLVDLVTSLDATAVSVRSDDPMHAEDLWALVVDADSADVLDRVPTRLRRRSVLVDSQPCELGAHRAAGSPARVPQPATRVSLCGAMGRTIPENVFPIAPATDARDRWSAARVLVIEDAPLMQLVLRRQLQRMGIEPVVAKDGREGIRVGNAARWDLVLLDLQLPYNDGATVARRLRAHHGPELPIVAMSGHFSEEVARELLSLGVEAHFVKPVEASELHDIAERWLPRSAGPSQSGRPPCASAPQCATATSAPCRT